MRMHRACVIAAALLAIASLPADAQGRFGFGREPSEAELRGWDIDISPDGAGLPAGRGTVPEGARIYVEQCASCHGDQGQGGPMDRLVGGQGTLASNRPIRTIGSFWPYATSVYDYIKRAMPFPAPQTLTPNEIYAVTAYLLYLNRVIPEDAVMDAGTLPSVRMPNAGGFTGPDPRPDVANSPCERECGPQ